MMLTFEIRLLYSLLIMYLLGTGTLRRSKTAKIARNNSAGREKERELGSRIERMLISRPVISEGAAVVLFSNNAALQFVLH